MCFLSPSTYQLAPLALALCPVSSLLLQLQRVFTCTCASEQNNGTGLISAHAQGFARVEVDHIRADDYAPGAHFGEYGLMESKPRAATVVATAEAICFKLDPAGFGELNPHVVHELDACVEGYAAWRIQATWRANQTKKAATASQQRLEESSAGVNATPSTPRASEKRLPGKYKCSSNAYATADMEYRPANKQLNQVVHAGTIIDVAMVKMNMAGQARGKCQQGWISFQARNGTALFAPVKPGDVNINEYKDYGVKVAFPAPAPAPSPMTPRTSMSFMSKLTSGLGLGAGDTRLHEEKQHLNDQITRHKMEVALMKELLSTELENGGAIHDLIEEQAAFETRPPEFTRKLKTSRLMEALGPEHNQKPRTRPGQQMSDTELHAVYLHIAQAYEQAQKKVDDMQRSQLDTEIRLRKYEPDFVAQPLEGHGAETDALREQVKRPQATAGTHQTLTSERDALVIELAQVKKDFAAAKSPRPAAGATRSSSSSWFGFAGGSSDTDTKDQEIQRLMQEKTEMRTEHAAEILAVRSGENPYGDELEQLKEALDQAHIKIKLMQHAQEEPTSAIEEAIAAVEEANARHSAERDQLVAAMEAVQATHNTEIDELRNAMQAVHDSEIQVWEEKLEEYTQGTNMKKFEMKFANKKGITDTERVLKARIDVHEADIARSRAEHEEQTKQSDKAHEAETLRLLAEKEETSLTHKSALATLETAIDVEKRELAQAHEAEMQQLHAEKDELQSSHDAELAQIHAAADGHKSELLAAQEAHKKAADQKAFETAFAHKSTLANKHKSHDAQVVEIQTLSGAEKRRLIEAHEAETQRLLAEKDELQSSHEAELARIQEAVDGEKRELLATQEAHKKAADQKAFETAFAHKSALATLETDLRSKFDAEFKRIVGEHAQTVWGFEAQIQQVEQEKEQELVRLTEERRALENAHAEDKDQTQTKHDEEVLALEAANEAEQHRLDESQKEMETILEAEIETLTQTTTAVHLATQKALLAEEQKKLIGKTAEFDSLLEQHAALKTKSDVLTCELVEIKAFLKSQHEADPASDNLTSTARKVRDLEGKLLLETQGKQTALDAESKAISDRKVAEALVESTKAQMQAHIATAREGSRSSDVSAETERSGRKRAEAKLRVEAEERVRLEARVSELEDDLRRAEEQVIIMKTSRRTARQAGAADREDATEQGPTSLSELPDTTKDLLKNVNNIGALLKPRTTRRRVVSSDEEDD